LNFKIYKPKEGEGTDIKNQNDHHGKDKN